jgi:hypothetical protein
MGIQVFSRRTPYVGADGGTAAPATVKAPVNIRIAMMRLCMRVILLWRMQGNNDI